MFTLFVKNLELIEQLSSNNTKIDDVLSKCFRLPVSPVRNSGLIKLFKFLTSFFLISKKWVNRIQNLIKSVGSKRPYDHRVMSGCCWFSVKNRTAKPFQKPRENRKFGVPNFKRNNPIFISSFAFRFPMLYSEASFSVNQSGKVCQIGRRSNFCFLYFFKGLEILFVYTIIHMDFLFYLTNKFFSVFMTFYRNFFANMASSFRNFLNQITANGRRFSFEDKIWKAGFKNFFASIPFDIPQPCISSVLFFRSLMKSSFKFINKICAYLFVYGTNLKRAFVNLYRWFLSVNSATNTAITINVTGQISKFHDVILTDKLNYYQYPQRLTGLDSCKKEYVIV